MAALASSPVSQTVRRVLHVTSGLGVGGAETMLYRLVRAMHGVDGQRHAIITLTDNNSFDFDALGVPVKTISLHGRPLSGLLALRAEIEGQNPDIVQAWMYHGNVCATLMAPKVIPVVWGIHHSLHDLHNEKTSTRIAIRAGARLSRWQQTRHVVYVSERSREHHAAFGYAAEKAVVIPNGFDCTVFCPDFRAGGAVRAALGFGPNDVLIGNFGRYHAVKDHPLLLRAFASIARKFPKVHLLLAGSGVSETNDELTGMIRQVGLSSRVRLLGPRNDMPALYNALDLYVLCSRTESFPNVLGEAGACGIPCITTDVGDAWQIVGDSGIVVPPGDTDALAAALNRTLSLSIHERGAMGSAAQRHVASHFSLEMVRRAYADLYSKIGSDSHASKRWLAP